MVTNARIRYVLCVATLAHSKKNITERMREFEQTKFIALEIFFPEQNSNASADRQTDRMEGLEVRKKFIPKKKQVAKPPVESTPPVSITPETPQGGEGQGGEKLDTTQRGTCWSIVINNPRPGEERCDMPGWRMTGQFEVGKETGTRHWQGQLRTPQVRWSQVKAMYPRANISKARNEFALKNYVRKEDTRQSSIVSSGVLNIFQFQDVIAGDWNEAEYESMQKLWSKEGPDDVAMRYIDSLVSKRIRNGQRGAEWIAMNNLWRCTWKKFYRDIIARYGRREEISSEQGQGTNGPRELEISEALQQQWESVCEEGAEGRGQEPRNEIC